MPGPTQPHSHRPARPGTPSPDAPGKACRELPVTQPGPFSQPGRTAARPAPRTRASPAVWPAWLTWAPGHLGRGWEATGPPALIKNTEILEVRSTCLRMHANRPLPLEIPGLARGGHSGGCTAPPGPGRPCLAPAASQRLLSTCCVAGVHLDSEGAVGESEQPRLMEPLTWGSRGQPWSRSPGEPRVRVGRGGGPGHRSPHEASEEQRGLWGQRFSDSHPLLGLGPEQEVGAEAEPGPGQGPERAGQCPLRQLAHVPEAGRSGGEHEAGLPAGPLAGRQHPHPSHGGRPCHSPRPTRPPTKMQFPRSARHH